MDGPVVLPISLCMGPVAAVRVFVAAHIFFVNTVVTTDLILRLDRQSGAVEISGISGVGRV